MVKVYVKPYIRNRRKVSGHYREQNLDRGEIGKERIRTGKRTAWLKGPNSQEFIGRANSEGETSANPESVGMYGKDTTENVAERRAERIMGRSEGATVSNSGLTIKKRKRSE